MGKSKTKKRKQTHLDSEESKQLEASSSFSTHTHNNPTNTLGKCVNPLEEEQQTFLTCLSVQARNHFFSPKHVTPKQRAKIWEDQAELGERLVEKYSWATPDRRVLRVFQYFAPIVEVGCGSNAYWAKWMNSEGGVDVVALDITVDNEVNIGSKSSSKLLNDGREDRAGLVIRYGGPSTLSTDVQIRDSGRTLFLCYPDEEIYQQSEKHLGMDDEGQDDDSLSMPISMAKACLEHFTGSVVIHVGELYSEALNLDQAPWGRSSAREFQEHLATDYHCILKMRLENNWLHVRDTLSVWKRSETCCIAYETDESDNIADEDHYRYIPPEEVIPTDLAAPCVAHLLDKDVMKDRAKHDEKQKKIVKEEPKEKRNPKASVAGNAY